MACTKSASRNLALARRRRREGSASAQTARQAKLTLVVYTGVAAAQRIQDELLHGLPADTPVAIVQDATLLSLRQALCTMDCLYQTLTEGGMASP